MRVRRAVRRAIAVSVVASSMVLAAHVDVGAAERPQVFVNANREMWVHDAPGNALVLDIAMHDPFTALVRMKSNIPLNAPACNAPVNINDGAYKLRYDCPLMRPVLVTAGDGNDKITAQGLDLQLRVFGGPGDDILTGRAFNALPVKVYGEGDNDTLSTPGNAGFLEGGPGVDTITGSNVRDEIFGGDDKDKLIGQDGDDLIDGGRGPDTILGGGGADDIFTGPGPDADNIQGDHGADQFWLKNGALDTVACGVGADKIEQRDPTEKLAASCE